MTEGPILITGGGGQLALALDRACAAARLPSVRVGRPEFDFDRPESVAASFERCAPSLVVNAAAYTAVDAAESAPDAAARANRDGPAQLAKLCAAAVIPLIHVSTDYVFDGTKGAPYVESDPTGPTGVYGATKLAGEHAVLAASERAIILRTSWVYSPDGKNFVRSMLNAAQRTNTLRVVADQRGCPTAADDLAAAILAVMVQMRAKPWQQGWSGVYHAAGSGWTTWHGLAVATFEEAAGHGRPVPTVQPIQTVDWPTPARRPADSRLDCVKLADIFGVRLPQWRDGLARTIDHLLGGPQEASDGKRTV